MYMLDKKKLTHVSSETNDDGRCPNLLPSDYKVEKGVYRVTFETKEFFARKGEKCFYPYVQVRLDIQCKI